MKAASALEQRPELKNYIHWMDVTASEQCDIDPDLLFKFCEQFARIAKVLGAEDPGIIAALDQALALVHQFGGPTTKLYLAKAACCGSVMTEHAVRKMALEDAVRTTKEGTAKWADAMLALSQYYTDVSRYDDAIATIKELREKLSTDLLTTRYECGASVYEAYAKIASMRDPDGAERDLERALMFESDTDRHEETAMWVSMAYYRKGRLAQMRQNHVSAVSNYLKAKQVRERWARDPRTFAFIHLRIAESLTSSGRLAEAEEQLDLSKRLFDACSDRSSGWLQCCLARADLEVALGRPDVGIDSLNRARLEARQLGFRRGELLCLVRLTTLHARRYELRPTINAVSGLMRAGLDRELKGKRALHLLRQLPALARNVSIKIGQQVAESSDRHE